ncbi:uncharacterized protein M437DRAFT_42014, partial [Aureobasidium melanogenum CBS 110374]
SIEAPPYCIPTIADISVTCMIHCCIGKKGHGILVDSCKVMLSHNIRSVACAISKHFSKSDVSWVGTGYLVKLARLCLCQDCSQTQLSDVVIAWMHELENTNEPRFDEANSVVDDQKRSMVAEPAPVRTLVAASVATRDLFSKVCGFWS